MVRLKALKKASTTRRNSLSRFSKNDTLVESVSFLMGNNMEKIKKTAKKVSKKVKEDNEKGSRQALIEDLFYDFNRSRVEIYKMNFVRGIFFGLGSVIGGTVIIALLAWILSLFVQLPFIGQPLEKAQESIQTQQK